MQRFAVGRASIELRRGDITSTADVGDLAAIANAANSYLIAGGGVDGAIHAVAGPELAAALAEVKQSLPGGVLPPGGAVVTPGFRLPVGSIVHCVGPVYATEGTRAPELLRSAYTEALGLCRRYGFDSIGFPAISTGVYGYPLDEAARVAWRAVESDLAAHGAPRVVRFVLFDDRALAAFSAAAREGQTAR